MASLHRSFALALFTLGVACGTTKNPLLTDGENPATPSAEVPTPHDPNEIIVSTNGNTDNRVDQSGTSQLSARTTLLEDNEHLRDLLAKALATRRDAEQKLADTESRVRSLEAENAQLQESVIHLSEQVDEQTKRLADLDRLKSKLEKDRVTLAEMYALEKRQRLAFEKELLEAEIRSRTLSKDD
jgi:septal ring factor EnvC (AmiA/AmiB activator)